MMDMQKGMQVSKISDRGIGLSGRSTEVKEMEEASSQINIANDNYN